MTRLRRALRTPEERRTIRREALVVFVGLPAFVILLSALTGCSVASSYVDKGIEKLSADNVEQEYAKVIEGWNNLSVAADNACLAQSGSAAENGPTLVESPAAAYAAVYRTQVADYNSRQADIFKADLVGPPGYPASVPAFPEAVGAQPDFCSISVKLAALKEAA